MIQIAKYLFYFLLCLLLQWSLLDNLNLFGYLNAQLLIVFYLALPTSINKYVYMLIGFGIGMITDVFYGTGGIYTTAFLWVGFFRSVFVRLIVVRKEAEVPSIRFTYVEFGKLITYYTLGLLTFFLALYIMEDFSLNRIFQSTGRAITSTAFNITLFALIELLISVKKEKPFNA